MREQPRELFADAILSVTVTGSVIRIDFGSHGTEDGGNANEPPALEHRQRIIMPVEGFAHSFGVLEQVMQSLLKANNDSRSTSNVADFSARGGSPNFPDL